MRKLLVVLMLGGAQALGACGGGDPLVEQRAGERTTPRTAETRPATPDKSRVTPPVETEVENAAAKRRFIYLDARTLCGRLGVRRIVRMFSVKSGDAAEVARAYSGQNYSARFRQAGYKGCLEGFEK